MTAGAVSDAARSTHNLGSTQPSRQNKRIDDCQPCAFEIGPELAPFSVTFEVKQGPAGDRYIETLTVARSDAPDRTDVLKVHGMVPSGLGVPFFIAATDINFDGYNDLMLITSKGVANALADYWVSVTESAKFEYVGNFPVLTPNASKKTLSSYERGGEGGMLFEKKVFRFSGLTLVLVKSEKQEATGRVGQYRKTV